MVVYAKYGTMRPVRTLAKLAEQTEDWTLLKIQSIEIDLICPKDDEKPKRMARLNIKPDLLKSGRIQIDFETVQKTTCRLTGFETNGNPNEFFQQKRLLQISLDELETNPQVSNQFSQKVSNKATACVDDIGNGVFCNFDDATYQVGLLRNLMAFPSNITSALEIVDLSQRTLALCAATNKMVFTKIFDDDKLVESIQKHDFSNFVKAYEACQFL
uniref:Uncharacterized protein n=1 Tax=Panagrolaimus sp. JU765 TaxID=591449 RepID=A0AC34QXU4_9BILA